jgi:hypothetical protein
MAAHPRISRFIAEHPRASRFVLRIASHIPVISRFVPIAAHIAPVYNTRSRKRKYPTFTV